MTKILHAFSCIYTKHFMHLAHNNYWLTPPLSSLCRHSLATSSQYFFLAILLRIDEFHHSTQQTYRDRTAFVRVKKVQQDQLDLHTNSAALCSG